MQGSNEAAIFAEEVVQLLGPFQRIVKKYFRKAGSSQPLVQLLITVREATCQFVCAYGQWIVSIRERFLFYALVGRNCSVRGVRMVRLQRRRRRLPVDVRDAQP